MKHSMLNMWVNGREVSLAVPEGEILLDTLRERLGLTSVKRGCEVGECGACTVLLDGKAVRSCLILAIETDGQSVTTLEGVGKEGPTALQEAFVKQNVFQCGFCAPGVVLAASALLAENPQPGEHEVREALAGNLCRCTGYEPIIKAVLSVAKKASRRKPATRRKRS